jgi:hypothetical protein
MSGSLARMLVAACSTLAPLGATPALADIPWTYQGRLEVAGAPAIGSHEVRISVFPTATSGTVLFTQTRTLDLDNGLITADLVMTESQAATVFDGSPRWVGVEVRRVGDAEFTTLPRQRMGVAPTAARALRVQGLHFDAQTQRLGLNTTTPLARLDIRGGADANGVSDQFPIAVQWWNGGFRHWVSTRHDTSSDGGGNAFDFYVNSSATADGSTAPGVGNKRVLTISGEGAGGTVSTPRIVVTGSSELYDLDVNGRIRTTVLEIIGGADIAEPFDVAASADSGVVPGMVVTIDASRPGELRVADSAYDRGVAGVISGANGIAPGLTLRQQGEAKADGDHPVAMTGRVWVLADADASPIAPGDLLTSSPVAGHAMAARDASRSHGAVIGKAMTSLESGRGYVLVLVNLQ